MRKRVLVAESSDTNRRVAESLLRQNGYEVISVAAVDKAREVLQFSRPDLLIIGGDLLAQNGQPFYDEISANPRWSAVPLMIIEPMTPADLPFPPEVVIHVPIEPLEFVQRVTTFTGMANGPATPNPLSAMSADDDFLDQALGLDRIDVTNSEVMDKTAVNNATAQVKVTSEKLVGFDHVEEDKQSDSRKVESVMIREDKTGQIPTAPKAPTTTSKLEIMQDQYGLVDPTSFQPDPETQKHDYDWFINSMRDEIGGKPKPPAPQPPAISVNDSGSLRIQTRPMPNEDESVEAKAQATRVPSTSGVGTRPKTAGVEKFIDEFKKEIERIRSNEPDSIFVEEQRESSDSRSGKWEESLEKVSSQEVQLFTRQFAAELAEKIAEKIVGKIDPDKLLQLIKAEIIAHHNRKDH